MSIKFENMVEKLQAKIVSSYTEGKTLEETEKLSEEFLYAEMQVSSELSKADLDARMRKSGLKAVKAAIYMDTCAKADKKPTESQLENTVILNELVAKEQDSLDAAEVRKAELERLYDIFHNAQITYRGQSKGRFE